MTASANGSISVGIIKPLFATENFWYAPLLGDSLFMTQAEGIDQPASRPETGPARRSTIVMNLEAELKRMFSVKR